MVENVLRFIYARLTTKIFLQEGDAFTIPEFHKRGYRDPDDPRFGVKLDGLNIFADRKFQFWQLVITLKILNNPIDEIFIHAGGISVHSFYENIP